VKSTKKITSAMKMVAAAKLKRAQENAERTRPYAEKMKEIVFSLTEKVNKNNFKFGGRKNNTNKEVVLLVVCSSDRGLCGGFNGSIIKHTKKLASKLSEEGKNLKYIFVGKKAYLSLKRFCGDSILEHIQDFANPSIKFELAGDVRDKILNLFLSNEISECHLIFTEFRSAISQTVKSQKLLPVEEEKNNNEENKIKLMYEYEPSEDVILDQIIPKNIAIQIHSGLLENLASEQGSRMTAMDNATRNADDMIDNLTLFYNRSRQALITKELIEIISGAEAV